MFNFFVIVKLSFFAVPLYYLIQKINTLPLKCVVATNMS